MIQPGGKAFATQILTQIPDVDVMFQVAGATGNGVLQAACDKGIMAIGVDVDQYVSAPATAKCTVVSAEKKLKKNVSDAIIRVADGQLQGRPAQPRHQHRGRRPVAVPRLREPDHGRHPGQARHRDRRPQGRQLKACEETPFGSCDQTK